MTVPISTLHEQGLRTRITLLILGLLACTSLQIGSDQFAGAQPYREFSAIFIASSLGFLSLSLIFTSCRNTPLAFHWIILFAVLLRLLCLGASPLLEDDFYRYLWDARQTIHGINPWQYAPTAYFADARLSQEWQDILSGINHPELHTVYGPVLQAFFALAYLISAGELWPIQCLLVLVDIGILFFLHAQKLKSHWLLAYAAHPLVLQESIVSTHPDLLMVLPLLIASVFWKKSQLLLTGVFLGLAIATKISALVTLPLFLLSCDQIKRINDSASPHISVNHVFEYIPLLLRILISSIPWALGVALVSILVIIASYLPFLDFSSGSAASELRSLLVFGEEWRFNPLVFRVIELISPAAIARPLSGVLLLLSVFVIIVSWLYQSSQQTHKLSPAPFSLLLLALLLFSPVVNAWYWLWLLPFAMMEKRQGLTLVSGSGILAYINTHVFDQAQIGGLFFTEIQGLFQVPWIVSLLQIALIVMAVVYDRKHREN